MLEHRKMLRRVLHALTALSLAGIALIGCNRVAGEGTVATDPIRNEREPGETTDYHSAVPDSSGGGGDVSGGSSSETETEIEIEEDSASTDTDSTDEDKSEESSDGESDIEIEIEP
jgi:hypothetical protein